MNILPHKSWHVRTWRNIVRVKKDERKAAAEEQAVKDRAALAEKEFRTKLLRDKAAARLTEQGIQPPASSATVPTKNEEPQGHVNFFADIEAQLSHGSNKDHDEEKKKLLEEEQRKVGLLKYLGEGSTEYMKEVPWWSQAPSRPRAEPEPIPVAVPEPTRIINPTLPSISVTSRKRKLSKEKKKKKSKKGKKSKRKRRKRSSSAGSSSSVEIKEVTTSSVSMEKLREERMRREREERAKTEKLMRKLRGEDEEEKKTNSKPMLKQKYNSQFNPEFARQNDDNRQQKHK